MASRLDVDNARDRMLERPLPSSLEAERAVLGSMMLSERCALEASLTLTAEDFYLRAHQFVFRAMLALQERGAELNPVLIGEELKREGAAEQVGGTPVAFVSELTYGLPGFTTLKAYADVLREKALARQLIRVCNKVTTAALEGEDPPAQTAEEAREMLDALSRTDADALKRPLGLAEREKALASRHELFFRGVSDALPTGFRELDERLTGGGFRPKQLILLAARPSVGKSSLALDICANAAAEGRAVLLFSLEMGAEQLVDRLVSFESGLERWKIRPGMFESDYRRAVDSLGRVCRLPLTVDDSSRALSRITKFSRELSRRPETKPALIVVDYLQLVESEGRKGSRNDEVGSVSRGLKGLANELAVPVLALSQLSRDCERQGREPNLSDLRDSGELEQDADVVLFLHGNRPEEGAQFYERTLICAKQREGPLFRTGLTFNGALVSFRGPSHLDSHVLPDVPFS